MKIKKLSLCIILLMCLTGCQSDTEILKDKYPNKQKIIDTLSDDLTKNIVEQIEINSNLSFEDAYENGFYDANSDQLSYNIKEISNNVDELLENYTDGSIRYPELCYEDNGSWSANYTVYIDNGKSDVHVRFVEDISGSYVGFAIDFGDNASLEEYTVLAKYVLMGGTGRKYNVSETLAEMAIESCVNYGQYTISDDYKLYVMNGTLFMFV